MLVTQSTAAWTRHVMKLAEVTPQPGVSVNPEAVPGGQIADLWGSQPLHGQ